MSTEKELQDRSGSKCELCAATEGLTRYNVEPKDDEHVLACETCTSQMDDPDSMDANHWRCLNDSMWSEHPAVQVMAWRMLYRLKSEGWPQDLLDMLYLDDQVKAWAELGAEAAVKHMDCNGNILEAGDTVILTQTLDVKGSSLSAKRGTAVRGISLVHDNPEHIEGKVEGQKIVILTKFVKKKL